MVQVPMMVARAVQEVVQLDLEPLLQEVEEVEEVREEGNLREVQEEEDMQRKL